MDVGHHSTSIRQALINAGLNPALIVEFLEDHLELLKKINELTKLSSARETYIKNEITLTQVAIFKDLIDSNEDTYDEYLINPPAKVAMLHAKNIVSAVVNAGVSPRDLVSFLDTQLPFFKESNMFNVSGFSRDELARNAAITLHVSLLLDCLR